VTVEVRNTRLLLCDALNSGVVYATIILSISQHFHNACLSVCPSQCNQTYYTTN